MLSEQIFDPTALVFFAAAAVVALVVGAIRAAIKGLGARDALLSMVEAALLAFLGGWLARTFISLLLSLAHSRGAQIVVGWGFFLWPGIVDTIAGCFGAQLLTRPPVLLWIAAVVGSFTGMMDGLWGIHAWRGPGVLSFLLDVTWGLAGSTHACLLHLINFAWAQHASEPRTGAHRYERGMAFKPGYSLTQGAVMSNLSYSLDVPLFHHERTHVWQSRIFGPLFPLSYWGWLILFGFVGGFVGLAARVGFGGGAEKWGYFNNPWEVWSYAVQSALGDNFRAIQGRLIWSNTAVAVVAAFYFLAVLGLVVLIILSI